MITLFRDLDLTDETAWPEEKASRQRVQEFAMERFFSLDFQMDGFMEDANDAGLTDGEATEAYEIFRERMIRNLGGTP